jgi:peptide/nickel transport system ATP-binding protein
MTERASVAGETAGGGDRAPYLSIRDLRTYYDDDGLISREPPVRAVDGVDLDVREGETVGLVGESGCGKTTLGRTVLGLETATGGTVEVEGRDVTEFTGTERREWQQNAAFVFQDPEESLNERMTVGRIIKEPLDVHDWPTLTAVVEGAATVGGDAVPPEDDESPDLRIRVAGETTSVTVRERAPLSADDVVVETRGDSVDVTVEKSQGAMREDRVFDLLDRVGLNEEHFYRYPHQFSGGQRQRVGIARALALEPDFVVLDEPVSALDVSVQARIINLLEDLQDELGLTYLFIAHDLSVVRHIADRVAVMYLGNVVESGPTEDIFADPRHPYTVSLLSAIPGSNSPLAGERISLRGTPPSPRDPPEGCPLTTRCPAKIRPDEWDLPEDTWRALDTLYAVFRTRARSEDSTVDRLKRLLGREVEGAALEDVRAELLDDRDLPGEAERVVEEAVAAARTGEDRAAAERLREAFGSRCDAEHPDPGSGERTNRCIRRESGYEAALPTMRRRQREAE